MTNVTRFYRHENNTLGSKRVTFLSHICACMKEYQAFVRARARHTLEFAGHDHILESVRFSVRLCPPL